MKRRSIVILLVVSCLLVTALPGLVNAESALPISETEQAADESALPVSQTAQTADEKVEPQATRDYYFELPVPPFGSKYDQRTFTMTAGKYCVVQRTDTVRWNVSFRVVDASTLGALGDWIAVGPGQTKTIYTNTSGQTQQVKIEYSAVAPLGFTTTGWFKFGEF